MSKAVAVPLAFSSHLCLSINGLVLLFFSYLCSFQNNSHRLYFRPFNSVSWNMKWVSKMDSFFLEGISVGEVSVALNFRLLRLTCFQKWWRIWDVSYLGEKNVYTSCKNEVEWGQANPVTEVYIWNCLGELALVLLALFSRWLRKGLAFQIIKEHSVL